MCALYIPWSPPLFTKNKKESTRSWNNGCHLGSLYRWHSLYWQHWHWKGCPMSLFVSHVTFVYVMIWVSQFGNSCDECQKILLIGGTLYQLVSSPLSTFRCSALFQHKCPHPHLKNCYWKEKGSLEAGPMLVVSHWVMIWALDGCLSWTCIRHRTAQWQWFTFWRERSAIM